MNLRNAAPATILSLNTGSSSLKFGLFRVDAASTSLLLSGEAESTGGKSGDMSGRFFADDAGGASLISEDVQDVGQRETFRRIGALLADKGFPRPDAIGHRAVHGGPKLRAHCLIDDAVLKTLEDAECFAPLHVPASVSAMRLAREAFPCIPQAACFDTAFHAGMPDIARTLPIAIELRSEGIERYGFHGLSCESIVAQLAPEAPRRLVIAHLGNGASVTAVRDGTSIDTSMGMTPTGGIIMGTRSGDLDPGVLIYLVREKGDDAKKLEDLLDHRSGLLGVSGVSSDMRRLHEAAAANADVRLALDMFCMSAAKTIASMATALGGLDTIVFTGGIGEHDSTARAAICARLAWIGLSLDAARNNASQSPISAETSRCRILVLPSQEDEQIARHAWALLRSD